MGLIDKIMFWKKKEDDFDMPDLDMPDFSKDLEDKDSDSKNLGMPPADGPADAGMPELDPGINSPPSEPKMPKFDTSMPSANEPATGADSQSQFMPHSTNPVQTQTTASAQSSPSEKEVQLISAKLDTLKAQLDGISHRIAHIEKIATESQGEKKDDLW